MKNEGLNVEIPEEIDDRVENTPETHEKAMFEDRVRYFFLEVFKDLLNTSRITSEGGKIYISEFKPIITSTFKEVVFEITTDNRMSTGEYIFTVIKPKLEKAGWNGVYISTGEKDADYIQITPKK